MDYQEIISQFQTDPRKGVSTLFERYGQQLYGFAINQLDLDEDESYDVLYKTLEAVGKVISRYEFTSENHFTNWLFKIHKNNILQLIRSKKSKEMDLQRFDYSDWETEAKEMEDGDLNVEQFKPVIDKLSVINPYVDTPTHSQLMLAMQKALQQLSEIERDILMLRMNEYSYEEIAQMLGIENNQLKVKFNRAKAKVEKKTLEILNDSNNETR